MTELGYTLDDWERIAPAVRALTLKQIMGATGHAITFASHIKQGRYQPHPRQWASLRAMLVETPI